MMRNLKTFHASQDMKYAGMSPITTDSLKDVPPAIAVGSRYQSWWCGDIYRHLVALVPHLGLFSLRHLLRYSQSN
jgi:hypothetical protein